MLRFERQQFFWSRVRQEGDHLIWTGAATPRGYGKMFVEGRLEYAHRVAWCIARNIDLADIDDLTLVRINCDRNDCVAPEHFASKRKKSATKRTPKK
jgi:hypothetical protein